MLKSTFLPCIYLLFVLLFTISCNNNNSDLNKKIAVLQSEIAELKAIPAESEPEFIHTVYFYAAEGLTEQRKTEFMTGLAKLAKTPSIQKVYYGPPAGTDREIVDNNYFVAWICHFKSTKDHDAYQQDPIHLKFIEDYQDVWGKVLIYDNLLVE